LITFPGARVSVLFPILVFFWVVEIPALIVIGFWFVTQVFSGVASLADTAAQSGGVAWWAHVGGFAFGAALMFVLPKAPAPQPRARPASYKDRAREDTGLVGLAFGLVSLLSQLTQLVLLARLAVVFLGAKSLALVFPVITQLVSSTMPVIEPFALVVPSLRIDGHLVELPTVAAILVVHLIGVAATSIIANLAYRPRRLRQL